MSNYRIYNSSWNFRVEVEYYEHFMDQQSKNRPRSQRPIFEKDIHVFLWAFLTGISREERHPLQGQTKEFTKWSTWMNNVHLVNRMIGLTIGCLYKDDPDQIRKDYSQGDNFLGDIVKTAIQEYANAGFSEMTRQVVTEDKYFNDPSNLMMQLLSHLSEKVDE